VGLFSFFDIVKSFGVFRRARPNHVYPLIGIKKEKQLSQWECEAKSVEATKSRVHTLSDTSESRRGDKREKERGERGREQGVTDSSCLMNTTIFASQPRKSKTHSDLLSGRV